MITLSVLDQIPIFRGGSATQALQETLMLAQIVERLGYRRFWVAEHHGNYALACTAPEVIVPLLAANTKHIRVGTGGIILPHYSPWKVAEVFRTLQALFPGRIDLGFGRGPGAGPLLCEALKSSALSGSREQYTAQIHDLIDMLFNTLPDRHAYRDMIAMPDGDGAPEPWLLGAGPQGVTIAANLGLSFSFAQFIHKQAFPDVMETYRHQFCSSSCLSEPHASLAVRVLCADTEQEARKLALSFWLFGLAIQGRVSLPFAPGEFLRIPCVDEAMYYAYSEQDYQFMHENELMMIVGDPVQVKARLTELAALYQVNELMILTICSDFKARLRSFQLLAQAFDLVV